MAVPPDLFPRADLESVREFARSHAMDRYLAALLAPAAVRHDLIAIAAFAGEIERIPGLVSEPALGEIRLKWWLDWLDDLGEGGRTGNPVADVLGEVIVRRGLPREPIAGLIDVRGQELYGAPFSDQPEYEDFLLRSEGTLYQLMDLLEGNSSGTALSEGMAGMTEPPQEAFDFARAYGGVRQLLRLPMLARRGRC